MANAVFVPKRSSCVIALTSVVDKKGVYNGPAAREELVGCVGES